MQSNDITKFSDQLLRSAPPRQPLYRVEPKHLEGRYLECVSSYLSNCAAEHGTSPSIFLNRIVGAVADEFRDSPRNSFPPQTYAQRLDGRSEFPVRFVKMLSNLNGVQGLTKHTLRCLDPLTSRRGFLRDQLAWSPKFLDIVTKPFIPILWRLQWIKVCSKFRTPLQLCCPECGKAVHNLSARGNIGFCTDYTCQADLSCVDMRGVRSTTTQSYRSMDYEVWVSDQTESLIQSLHKNPLHEDYSFADSLNFWLEKFELKGVPAIGPKYFGVKSNALGLWMRGTTRPKVEHLFNFAWVFQLEVEDFLRKRVPERHDGQLAVSLAMLPIEKSGRPRRRIDHGAIRRKLQQIIRDDEYYYDSFREIAKRLHHCPGSIRDAFPEEAKILGQRYRMNKHIRARLRDAADAAEITEACTVIAEMNEVISARRVKAMVSKPSMVIDPKKGGSIIKEARRQQLDENRKKFS